MVQCDDVSMPLSPMSHDLSGVVGCAPSTGMDSTHLPALGGDDNSLYYSFLNTQSSNRFLWYWPHQALKNPTCIIFILFHFRANLWTLTKPEARRQRKKNTWRRPAHYSPQVLTSKVCYSPQSMGSSRSTPRNLTANLQPPQLQGCWGLRTPTGNAITLLSMAMTMNTAVSWNFMVECCWWCDDI